MKRIILFILCIFLSNCFMINPCLSEGSGTIVSDSFEYILLQDGTAEITKYTGDRKNLIIPSLLDGHPVKSLGESLFECSSLQAVIIEEGIENISRGAFYNCASLKRVVIPSSVKEIGDYAFACCFSLMAEPNTEYETYTDEAISLDDIGEQMAKVDSAETILKQWIDDKNKTEEDISKQKEIVYEEKDKLQSMLDMQAKQFSEESTDTITIPRGSTLLTYGLEHIGDYAFSCCENLGNFIIPDSVTSIGANPFSACSNIQITVSPGHPTLAVKDGVLFNKNEKSLVYYFSDKTEYEIPHGILSIDDSAFGNSKISSVTIPYSVSKIGEKAFAFCQSLKQIEIPNSVTSIGEYAFFNTGLTKVSIPDSVTSIGEHAFEQNVLLIITPGSAAETYCKENVMQYQYAESDMDWL